MTSTESPCVGICIMEGDVCIGCGRTAEEIFQAGVDAGYGGPQPMPRPTAAPRDEQQG